VNQAKALDLMLAGKERAVGVVIVMEVDEAALIKRVENRAAEAKAKGQPVRSDDDPETFKKRLAVYKGETAPILPYYEGQGKIARVDGMKSVAEVAAQIDAALSGGKSGKSWLPKWLTG
jgi:adenylate kinase